MQREYDQFAEAFGKSDRLPTWRYVGKVAMERMLKPYLRTGVKFLDLGSGSARVEAEVLLPNGVQAEDITGVEISPEQVKMAKVRVPRANFIVGDITKINLPPNAFDVAFSHMVFEHIDDPGLLVACKVAHRSLKPNGVLIFVVTHPDKMTYVDGSLVKKYGSFETTAPWGGVLRNWRRSIDQTVKIVQTAGFKIGLTAELPFPKEPPSNLDREELVIFKEHAQKYARYPAIRLAVTAQIQPSLLLQMMCSMSPCVIAGILILAGVAVIFYATTFNNSSFPFVTGIATGSVAIAAGTGLLVGSFFSKKERRHDHIETESFLKTSVTESASGKNLGCSIM